MPRSVALLFLLAMIASAACARDGAGDRTPGTGDRPAAASTVGAQGLNAERIPADLRHLIPMAEQWGIGDDVERIAKVDGATTVEREELRKAVEPHSARITQWLNSFGQGPLPDEAATFMYLQLALEEMLAGGPR